MRHARPDTHARTHVPEEGAVDAPAELRQVYERCIAHSAAARPTFEALVPALRELLLRDPGGEPSQASGGARSGSTA